MKAMILAAGFGKRLLPFTEYTPKALFPVGGRPLLDIIINNLQDSGCQAIIINTHHLYQKIDSFIAQQKYTIPVYTQYEPVILGTGGAVKNVADFWDDNPFMVINSDIVTDIDLKKVYAFHLNHSCLATMVLHDYSEFNTISVSEDNFITGINEPEIKSASGYTKKLAFTGIQVLDPEVLGSIPDNIFSSSIDAYRNLLFEGEKIKGFISPTSYWKDIGTPARYQEAVIEKMAPAAFTRAWPDCLHDTITRTKIKGDGSDRSWWRLTSGNRSLIMADHGIRTKSAIAEVDSFVTIGCHLYNKKIPVPRTYFYDTFAGLVFLEDLGDVNLQTVIQNAANEKDITTSYQSVINSIINMSIYGAEEFDRSWTYETHCYNKEFILNKECRYFVDAFLRGYLKMDLNFEDLGNEFLSLADKALEFSVNGFMHRDMQSRNIMFKNNNIYFIDFQGGRIGPLQYDLASLLIDPYVELPHLLQAHLLNYSVKRLATIIRIDRDKFCISYKYCAIIRNLQILGAFGYLSRIKGKTYFEKYIPAALKTLKNNLSQCEDAEFPRLMAIVDILLS